MRLFKPPCMCGKDSLGIRAAAPDFSCPRCGPEPYEEDLGVTPGYRITALKAHFLADEALEGADFERLLNEVLTPCEYCGSGSHVSDACGRSPERIRELENVQMVWASAAVIPGRSSASVVPSGMAVLEYGEQLRAAFEKDPESAGARKYRQFAGTPIFEVGKLEPVDHVLAYAPLPLETSPE